MTVDISTPEKQRDMAISECDRLRAELAVAHERAERAIALALRTEGDMERRVMALERDVMIQATLKESIDESRKCTLARLHSIEEALRHLSTIGNPNDSGLGRFVREYALTALSGRAGKRGAK